MFLKELQQATETDDDRTAADSRMRKHGFQSAKCMLPPQPVILARVNEGYVQVMPTETDNIVTHTKYM